MDNKIKIFNEDGSTEIIEINCHDGEYCIKFNKTSIDAVLAREKAALQVIKTYKRNFKRLKRQIDGMIN